MVNFKVIDQNFELVKKAQTGKITFDHLFQANISGILVSHSETKNDLTTVNKKIKEIFTLQK
ncbi:MAG: hypothetical protein HZR80_06465 [Candidatus Heimdallarchaeota archaeon]